jgi:hypothetical protein
MGRTAPDPWNAGRRLKNSVAIAETALKSTAMTIGRAGPSGVVRIAPMTMNPRLRSTTTEAAMRWLAVRLIARGRP